MGIDVTNLMTVAKLGEFNWFIFFLEDKYFNELEKYFRVFGEDVGLDNLAVRGYRPKDLASELYHQYFDFFFNKYPSWDVLPIPSIVITNIHPKKAKEKNLESPVLMVFPIPKDGIPELLKSLAKALVSRDSLAALRTLDKAKANSIWGWVRNYIELKPTIYGAVSIDVLKMFEDLKR